MANLLSSPANRIPIEIIRQILIYASQVDHQYRRLHPSRTHAPYFPYTSLFICKAWSSVLMGTPQVWRSVFILFDGTDDEHAPVRIDRHKLLSKSGDAEMHLDLYYQPPIGYGRCGCDEELHGDSHACSQHWDTHDIMGPAEMWYSLRVIIAYETKMSLGYIHRHILSPLRRGMFHNPRFLRRLAIVSDHGRADVEILGNEDSLGSILSRLDLEDLLISNLQAHDPEDRHHPQEWTIWGITSLRKLALENITINAIRFLRCFRFTELQEVIISNTRDMEMEIDQHYRFGKGEEDEEDEYETLREEGETLLEDVFGSAHTAKLELLYAPVARQILRGLADVEHLELTSSDRSLWPRLLAKSTYCENVETLTFHCADFGPDLDLLKSIVETRIDSLESIRVPNSFEGPLKISVGDTTLELERLGTHDSGFQPSYNFD
jgi:hypothetical protein